MAEPVIDFGSSGGFGTLAGWELQSSNAPKTNARANVLDEDGDEAASELYDETTETSATYKAKLSGSAPTIPANIGALVNSVILTSIALTTSPTDFVVMTLTGHNHTANAHSADPALASVAHGITLDDGFGVTDFLGGTPGANANCIGSTITISCEHNDVVDGSGDHLVGENYNPRMVATSDWVGTPSASDDGSWDITNENPTTENVDFEKVSYTGEKALAFTAVS